MLKNVIWATDGSPTTKSEYPVAKDIAESSGAKLIVAHAGQMVSSDQAGIFVDSTETLQAHRGYGPVSAIFLGSFTFRLLQVAPCPVVVGPTGRQRTA